MNTRLIPDSQRGRTYRRFLLVGGLLAAVGLADALRALVWTTLNGSEGATRYAEIGLRVAAWGLLAWITWYGARRRLVPPTWAIVALVVLIWAVILV